MHQIGNTFTRLEPAIEFAEASFQSNPNTVCIIGNPPERFAAIHSQGLLNAWYKRLQRCVAEPVQLEQPLRVDGSEPLRWITDDADGVWI